MTEGEAPVQEKWTVTGLYVRPETIEAASRSEASAEFHRRHPGMAGAVWKIETAAMAELGRGRRG